MGIPVVCLMFSEVDKLFFLRLCLCVHLVLLFCPEWCMSALLLFHILSRTEFPVNHWALFVSKQLDEVAAFHVCIYVCVCVCVCACMYGIWVSIYVCTHQDVCESQRWLMGCPVVSLPYFFETVWLNLDFTVSTRVAYWWAPGNLLSLTLQLQGYRNLSLRLTFYMGTKDLNLGPHACAANTTPSEPSPQPQNSVSV